MLQSCVRNCTIPSEIRRRDEEKIGVIGPASEANFLKFVYYGGSYQRIGKRNVSYGALDTWQHWQSQVLRHLKILNPYNKVAWLKKVVVVTSFVVMRNV